MPANRSSGVNPQGLKDPIPVIYTDSATIHLYPFGKYNRNIITTKGENIIHHVVEAWFFSR